VIVGLTLGKVILVTIAYCMRKITIKALLPLGAEEL
jgi:hypothetical protein